MQLVKCRGEIVNLMDISVYEIFFIEDNEVQLNKLIQYTNKVEKWIVELRIGGVGENSNWDTEAGAQGSKLRRKHL